MNRPGPNPAAPTLTVETGVLRGEAKDGVMAFRGIPYAAPPTADLRWRAPQPPTPWQGTRAADAYGNDGMQNHLPQVPGVRQAVSEDCLTLNVWAPTPGAGKLAVLFWIHGGGFNIGAGSWSIYDGTAFARQGVVLVTFNYRLGKFGFFAHPALTKENPQGPLGNYGLMDQIAALKWVQRNIADFGGDPDNVTIFGESAGAGSVNALMVSPHTEGLFAKAIAQSGGGGQWLNFERTLLAVEAEGLKAMRDIGVVADDAPALRAVPAAKVLGDTGMASGGGPFIDGEILTASIREVFEGARQRRIPYLVGANNWEGGLFASFPDIAAAWDRLGPAKERVLATYDGYGTHDEKLIKEQFIGDAMMVAPARALARSVARSGAPTYLYNFSYVPSTRRATDPGAGHGAEIPFVFNTLAELGYGAADDSRMAATMADLWVQFAKTGKPGAAWPSYSEADDVLMEFASEGAVVTRHFAKQRLDLVDQIFSGRSAATQK